VLQTTEQAAFEAMRYLECNPEFVESSARDVPISVEPHRGRYHIIENGRVIEEAVDIRSIIDFLHARMFSYALRERPRSGIIHAALMRRRGKRILVAGRRGAGKTTLTLRLADIGCEMEGDEHVFIDNDGVIARPRAYRVKQTALALLPELADVVLAAPSYEDVRGSRIFNVDPTTISGNWRIEKGNVDCVIVLQPNHGGYSSLRPIAPMMAAQAIISELGMRDLDRGASIAAVAALVGRAKNFDLSLGDHANAKTFIEQALDDNR
jgi:serine kinase of HPr protein (carbohydrate metabolism regulator)